MKPQSAVWIGETQIPAYGTKGVCWPAAGFSDPDSAEEGAYLFQPDGDENGYYCDPERDLDFYVA